MSEPLIDRTRSEPEDPTGARATARATETRA